MDSRPLLQQLVSALQCLPSVGRKSAQRMAYYLLEKNRQGGMSMSAVIDKAMREIKNCERCRNYTELPLCDICSNVKRDDTMVCVVESPADAAAIEATASFSGKYFILMGSLSPLDGIGPEEIGLDKLQLIIEEEACQEIIIATSATVEGEATAHFIASMVSHIENKEIRTSRLAQGVPVGGELEYLDQSTLALSLANRQNL